MPPSEKTFVWTSWFDAPPARVWPFVADTDRVNRRAGLPAGRYARADGPGARDLWTVRQRFQGLVPVAYDEEPFEWVEGEGFAVERRFRHGPVTRLLVDTRLAPDGRGTRVTTTLVATPRSRLTAFLVPALVASARRGHERAYDRAREALGGVDPDGAARGGVRRRAAERLARVPDVVPAAIEARLSAYLAAADGADLRRMRPFALADAWRCPRREVLAAFLGAVRAGVLELSWESLCPHCRGSAARARALAEVRGRARCPSCDVEVDVELDRSLEAVFRPAADLRTVPDDVWCLAGPRATPHVAAQRRLRAGSSTALELVLAPGAYRVRCPRRAGAALLRAEDDATLPREAVVDVADGDVAVSRAAVGAGRVRLDVRCAARDDRPLVVERTAWADEAATALDLLTLPGFHDVFADDVLAPGERIAVRRVAVLFTDLRGSTSLYRRVGDAAAYALVREHFRAQRAAVARHGGMVVKTIGDAVMAVFRSAGDAVAAALEMHREVAALPVPDGAGALAMKAGVHRGPSIAVHAGGRLDFFGTTANLAARAQHEARGGDVVLTAEVAQDEDVRGVLAGVAHAAEPFRAALRGFDAETALVRVVPAARG